MAPLKSLSHTATQLDSESGRVTLQVAPWDTKNFHSLQYQWLVYTTQVNSTFRARWLASSEVISQVLFTSEQPKKNKVAFVAIF